MNTPSAPQDKAVIGVLASWDSEEKNSALANCFQQIYRTDPNRLGRFHFLFTGGTFDRMLLGGNVAWDSGQPLSPLLPPPVREVILSSSTRLPDRRQGGVTVLANYLVKRQCSIIWPFLDPAEAHWLNPENLALTRLCDVWRVKRLRNSGSVVEWFETEAEKDAWRNCQQVPPPLKLSKDQLTEDEFARGFVIPHVHREGNCEYTRLLLPQEANRPKTTTIALIAHDEMKPRMAEFAVEYEAELMQFGRIFATRTTGREIEESVPSLKDKIVPVHSGPKGGDIQIAAEILYRRCDVVIFFLDPMRPHPHADDIRVVLSACMVENSVRILTNEVEARDWMEEVVRRGRLSKAIARIRSATAAIGDRNSSQ